MNFRKTLATACAVSLVFLAGCGGGSDQQSASTKAQPASGVPAGTSPLPMPKVGHRYDNPQKRSDVKNGGTLTLPTGDMPANFNGFSVDGAYASVGDIDKWTMPHLWSFTVGGKPSPNTDFLQSAKLVDTSPETVKYTLNPRAHWNNGDPITWKAFKTTWLTQSGKTKKYNPQSTDGYKNIKSVTKGKTPNIAVVTFDKPFYPYQAIFQTLENPKNLDPTFYKKGWVDDPRSALRAGPFTVQSHSKSQITLVRNKSWWGDKPKLDKVVYRQMEDQAAINAFQNGEIDATEISDADNLGQIADIDNVMIRRGFGTAVTLYTIGQDSELFKLKYARRAFAFSTDRTKLAKISFQGMDWKAKPAGSLVMYPWMPTYENNMKWLRHDTAKAKKLMKSHGWQIGDDGYFHKGGQVAEFTYVTFGDSPKSSALARAQQAMSKKAGLKMIIDNRPSSDFSKTANSGSFDILTMGWSVSDPYGYATSCQLYCSTSAGNDSKIGNATIDAMMHKSTTIPNAKKSIRLANKAEARALREVGRLPLYASPKTVAVEKGLANYGPAGWKTAKPQDIGWAK
ncbi:ABC transporter family substrate-binding protein [Spelaeicoccus albus]|uniref:Peptide/nickel transport system substrate-binding protein n=1 Tax=Spelaeicoccus albus TaxID=1280376 RepID=A0A7Z0IJ64_9MICO|nr:ABC transporter family substrate-binding protein [Spelaeicoccus albus]NYI69198.1 peptide/nickel transport system substrate-binding protein [Spelaeicoccus albus]